MLKRLLHGVQPYGGLISGVVLLSALVVWLIFGRITMVRSYYLPDYANTVYSLTGNAVISQDFTAKYPGLYQIDLYLKGTGEKGKFVIHLKESCQAASDLNTFVIDSASLTSLVYPLTFSPIDDSTNSQFCIVLETQSANQPEVAVYGSQVDVYPLGEAHYRANTLLHDTASPQPNVIPRYFVWLPLIQKSKENPLQNFDIAFRLHYRGPVLKTIPVLLTRLAAYKPWLFGETWFYGFLAVLYLLLLLVFYRVVFKTKL